MKPNKKIKAGDKPVPEADFDDTIAQNRALPLVDVAAVPRPPLGYRATDPEVRNRRLRKVAAEHRAEALDALAEAAGRDMPNELGKYAPDPERAAAMAERLARAGGLVTVAQALLAYAREMDQIALSDAILLLEQVHRELSHAAEHEPLLAEHYPALRTLFEARREAIAEGRARAAREAEVAPAEA
ncbi:hypothetical protein [Polyangium aurulentum]|uniref:hypothetical protein n=1 Tax=Polyangium aurulentum TaxID=2567896 RepID=UPI0010ADDF3C|nr:hypothetical protein [Polyangium aurulentum]UQA59856.1 hypothetical protein E8A73_004985 [Polyangium aurulentum]